MHARLVRACGLLSHWVLRVRTIARACLPRGCLLLVLATQKEEYAREVEGRNEL